MGFLKRPKLRSRDDQRTRAAELTLRESIYPLCLVTILFFLWVSRTVAVAVVRPIDHSSGLLLRPHRHAEQAFPSHAWHHALPLVWAAGSILWRLPAGIAGPRKLAAATLGLQSHVHLGTDIVWHWLADRVAVSGIPVVWRFLCRHLRYRQWTRVA